MLAARSVYKTYPNGVKGLQDLSLSLETGETLGLVGESGCGKSSLARVLSRLISWDRGSIELDGAVFNPPRSLRPQAPDRSFYRKIQLIFQDPSLSLDPRCTVFQTLKEPLDNYGRLSPWEIRGRIAELLEEAGLSKTKASSYPHELSGGQRQRVAIARAIAVEPRYLICDEPVSSLDAEARFRIVDLLKALQKRHTMGMLFISHDTALTERFCDRIAFMNGGKIWKIDS